MKIRPQWIADARRYFRRSAALFSVRLFSFSARFSLSVFVGSFLTAFLAVCSFPMGNLTFVMARLQIWIIQLKIKRVHSNLCGAHVIGKLFAIYFPIQYLQCTFTLMNHELCTWNFDRESADLIDVVSWIWTTFYFIWWMYVFVQEFKCPVDMPLRWNLMNDWIIRLR